MNNLNIFYISAQYVKSHSSVMDNVEEKIITSHILEAQNINLQQIMGSPLYEDLTNDIATYQTAKAASGDTVQELNYLSQEYITLKNEFCKPVVLYYSLYESCLDMVMKFTNRGIVQQNSENSSIPDIALFNMARANFKNKAEFYAERLMKELITGSQIVGKYTKYLNWVQGSQVDTIEPTNDNYFCGLYLGDSGRKIVSNTQRNPRNNF